MLAIRINTLSLFLSPIDMSLHMTEGVAKQAKTSSVLEKCVRCGMTTD